MATFAGVIVRRLSNFTNVYNRMETTNKKIRGSENDASVYDFRGPG